MYVQSNSTSDEDVRLVHSVLLVHVVYLLVVAESKM